jgi:hypothetical protein
LTVVLPLLDNYYLLIYPSIFIYPFWSNQKTRTIAPLAFARGQEPVNPRKKPAGSEFIWGKRNSVAALFVFLTSGKGRFLSSAYSKECHSMTQVQGVLYLHRCGT